MVWTTPHTFRDGDILTAAQINAIEGNLDETPPSLVDARGQLLRTAAVNDLALIAPALRDEAQLQISRPGGMPGWVEANDRAHLPDWESLTNLFTLLSDIPNGLTGDRIWTPGVSTTWPFDATAAWAIVVGGGGGGGGAGGNFIHTQPYFRRWFETPPPGLMGPEGGRGGFGYNAGSAGARGHFAGSQFSSIRDMYGSAGGGGGSGYNGGNSTLTVGSITIRANGGRGGRGGRGQSDVNGLSPGGAGGAPPPNPGTGTGGRNLGIAGNAGRGGRAGDLVFLLFDVNGRVRDTYIHRTNDPLPTEWFNRFFFRPPFTKASSGRFGSSGELRIRRFTGLTRMTAITGSTGGGGSAGGGGASGRTVYGHSYGNAAGSRGASGGRGYVAVIPELW